MTLRVTNTQEKELRFIRALVYGESGIGKTKSLGELPEDKTLIVVTERGLLPLQKQNYRAVMVESWEDVRDLYRALYGAKTEKDGSITVMIDGKTIPHIRIVAFDSMTELARLCVKHMMQVDRPALIKARTKGKTEEKENVDTMYEEQMQTEDWGVLSDRLGGYIAAIVKLPVHIIFTALAKWHESKALGNTLCVPSIKGGTARECPAHFDQVLHMESNASGERMWRTFNDGVHVCKDSSGDLDKFEPASWNNLFAKILTETKQATETETTEG